MTLRLDWCSHEAAKYAVMHWHYSRRMPEGKLVKIGAWEDERFIGAVIFGSGASDELGRRFGATRLQTAELVRIALTNHATPVSRIVRFALRMLKDVCPALRVVVSFADPAQGHVGSVYQAMNWYYTGMSSPDAKYIYEGKEYHSRGVSESGIKKVFDRIATVPKPSECIKIITPGKLRYVYPLDPAMREQIAPLAKPYPKRATSIEDAPAIHAGEGGSQPTVALQFADTADVVTYGE